MKKTYAVETDGKIRIFDKIVDAAAHYNVSHSTVIRSASRIGARSYADGKRRVRFFHSIARAVDYSLAIHKF